MMDYPNPNIVNDKEASEQLQALFAVSNLLATVAADGENIDAIMPGVFTTAINLFKAHDANIILINNRREIVREWVAGDSLPDETHRLFINHAADKGLVGWVIEHQQADIVHDTRTDPRCLSQNPDHPVAQSPWSAVCTPFKTHNRIIGAVTIHKPGVHQFNQRDIELLTIIANQAAATIEKARILDESRRQLRISSLLNEASRIINSSLDLNVVMQSMLAQMNEFLHAEAISIALVDEQSNELVYQVAEGIGSDAIVGLRLPSNQGLSGWVMEQGEPALVADTKLDPRFRRLGDRRTGIHTQAMICAPMQYKQEVLGTIQAINPIGGTFTERDLNLLVNLANIASSAIANAQQFARTQVAEARYTSLVQDSIDPIILTSLSGEILDANRRAFAFAGYDREQMLNMCIRDLYPKDALLPHVERMEADTVRVFNSQMLTKNGRSIHVEVYAKRTSYGDQEFVQWIYHDISKQIELEEMRKDLQAMLFHDLQSPLGNVISSLELLTYELPENSSPALLDMLDIAVRSSGRLQTLVRSLLDINQLEAGHPISAQNRISVISLFDETWETVKPGYEKRKIPLVRQIAPNLPDVYVEEDMIRRVLVNLLDNAIKYSPESDHITLQAIRENEAQIIIRVSDQGEGIPEDLRDSIFEKFRRIKTDTYSKGLGLGLAFCRLAVEAHGGKIWVDDAPEGGARFNFTLPVWNEESTL
jgi:PAS domain S-box-containing protein